MQIQIVPSLAEPVGYLWRELQLKYTAGGRFGVASPLSSTTLPIYRWIVDNAHTFHRWEEVLFVLMDEQLEGTTPPFRYIPADDSASYEGFARRHFLDTLESTIATPVEVTKPQLDSMDEFAVDIHLLVLALGVSGNYANVMPGIPEHTGWHVAALTPEFRHVHTHPSSQSYAGALFREFGMSLGPRQVLSAKHVVVIASGTKKRDLVKQLLTYDSFCPDFPLSIIHHPRISDSVSVFLTQDVGR